MRVIIHGILPMIAALSLGYRLLALKHRMRSASPTNQRASQTSRAIELSVIAILAGILGWFITTDGVGPIIPIKSAAMIRGSTIGVIVLMTLSSVALATARNYSMSRIAMALGAAIMMGTVVFASTALLSYKRFVDEIRQVPVPVEITVYPPVSGVDVIINGVSMGRAPLSSTIDEIIRKTPSRSGTKPVHSAGASLLGIGYLDRKRIQLPQATHVVDFSDPETPLELDFEFTRHGKPILVCANLSWSNGMRMHGQITPARISFGVMTKEWEQDVTTLLTKARLADYQVDHAWIEAVEPYSSFVRPIILKSIQKEPRFQQVLNDWAMDRYQLDDVNDSSKAWQVFQSICREADESRTYRTNSTMGDAVELMLDKLNPEQVIAAAEKRLSAFESEGSLEMGWSWNFENGLKSFSYDSVSSGRLRASDFALAHVIWKLSTQWSAQNADQDSPLQRCLSPRLLRLSYSQPMVRPLAEAIGGSVVETFLQRLQKDVHGFEPSADPTKNEYLEGEPVLKDFWTVVNATDHVGARFRRDHATQAIEFAKQRLARSFGMVSIPNWMNFLFLEVDGRGPLASDTWKAFQVAVENDPASRGHSLNLKWDYLAHIRPAVDVSEFIRVVPKGGTVTEDFFHPETSLASLPNELKFDIATRSLPILRNSKELHDSNSIPYVVIQRMINQLVTLISTIPLDDAADFIQSIQDASGPEEQYLTWALQAQSQSATMTVPLLNALSKSEHADHRKWTLPQLEQIPTSENRERLRRLQNDDDPGVREAANMVAARIKELRQRELPRWVD